ncbi:unnamed protein product [Ambrosiozyma monospora]|uniref:Unnamed protein product n=1 Tax=Ambrosiozyma monospora TaxID=43982 RepID=A0ACB5TA41_AMBMO|nr:unnamed protein product [Ambrosiozyma monospora]
MSGSPTIPPPTHAHVASLTPGLPLPDTNVSTMPNNGLPATNQPASVYIVTQISTTAEEPSQTVSKDSSEIIEVAWALVDSASLTQIDKGSCLIKPINTPISPLCTSTTGLTWDSVKNAGSLKDAVEIFDKSIEKQILSENRPFSFVTFNSWDLRMKLPKESREKSIQLPRYLEYARLFDLKKEFVKLEEYLHPDFFTSNTLNQVTLNQVISTLDVSLSDIKPVNEQYADSFNLSTPRRAGDDVQIMVKVLTKLIQTAPVHLSLLKRPHDLGLDLNQFYTERSRILYLTNLPGDTTQSELESWFTQFGGRPVAFWVIKTPGANDMNNGSNGGSNHSSRSNSINGASANANKPTCSGFVVFTNHEEAVDSLGMTGRVLNDRVIEVQPSSVKVFDRAQEILTLFPSSKNRPRPGDWTCPSCGFSNFQRRTACFRCSFPAASAAAIQGSIYGGNNSNNNNNGNNNNNNMNKMNYHNNNNNNNGNYQQ